MVYRFYAGSEATEARKQRRPKVRQAMNPGVGLVL